MVVSKHGTMTFFGIEIPVDSIYVIKRSYNDKCGHPHMANSRKAKYDFCEKCGTARFYVEKCLTDVGKRLYDRLIFAELEDPQGNVVTKYYAVMEWYNTDVKINFTKYSENLEKRDEFKALLKDVKLWRAKRFGLFIINNVTPTVAFYKNKSLQNNTYAEKALCIDPELEMVYAKQNEDDDIEDHIKPANVRL